jgi:hypothetical protein
MQASTTISIGKYCPEYGAIYISLIAYPPDEFKDYLAVMRIAINEVSIVTRKYQK